MRIRMRANMFSCTCDNVNRARVYALLVCSYVCLFVYVCAVLCLARSANVRCMPVYVVSTLCGSKHNL